MADKAAFTLPWPIKGIDRNPSFREQTLDSTKSAQNVRNVDSLDSRVRGGSRPGLCKEYSTQLGSGNPVRMLGRVSVATDSTRYRWLDDFARDTLGSDWTTASWLTAAPSTKASLDGSFADNATNGAVCKVLNFASASAYTVELYCVPWLGTYNATFSIFARMADATPVATTDGIVAALTLSGTSVSLSLTSYVSGVGTNYTNTGTGTVTPGWFRVHVSSNTITVSWQGTTLLTQAVSAHSGKRVGFGLSTTGTWPTYIALVDVFRVLGAPVAAGDSPGYTEYIAAIANGSLYTASNLEVLSAVSGSVNDFATDRNLRCAELFQKLYIADWSEVKKATATGSVASGTTFDDATVSDWTTLGLDIDTDVVVISNPTGPTAGTYKISTIAAGALTLASSAGSDGSCSYRIARCPKVWDPVAGTVSLLYATSGKGQVPNECPLVAAFKDRIFLAGASQAPHVWYCSRQGDPLDWDYAETDVGRAVAGTNDTGAGTIGVPITAMFASSNDNLVMAGKNSIQVLRGDPVSGQFDTLSDRIGIISAGAWCKGPNGETYILSRDGVYVIPAGETGIPQPLSRERLPLDLIDIDTTMYEVTMMYNLRQQGVHIWLAYKSGVAVGQWFLDVKRGAFWYETIPSTMEVFSAIALQVNTISQSELILGCRDGYLRRFSISSQTDDGTSITSNVYLGPMRLGGDDYNGGQILELDATLDEESGPVDWSLSTAQSSEGAWSANAGWTGSWAANGCQYRSRPMAGGMAMVLKLQNNNARAWATEKVYGVVAKRGRLRKG